VHPHDLHERIAKVRAVLESRLELGGAVHELNGHVEHLGDEVAVREPPLAERSAALRVDPDRDATNEGLESDGRLDRPSEGARGPVRDRYPEVLVKDAPELDPGFEEERLPT